MNNEELKNKILTLLPSAEVIETKQFLTAHIALNEFHALAKKLKETDEMSFDYLFCLTGVDEGETLSVVYHLRSTQYGHEVVLKVKAENRENPVVDTVCDIWKTAEFHEREIFDLFGIKFNHHPNLKRIFLEETWQGFPLRKDYVDEVNIVER